MNKKSSDPESDPLRELLQAWRVETPLPPKFQDRVWHRINRQQAGSILDLSSWWTGLVASVGKTLQQPLGAMAYLSALLVAGLAVGYWSAEHYAHETETAWRTAYLQAVIPSPALQH